MLSHLGYGQAEKKSKQEEAERVEKEKKEAETKEKEQKKVWDMNDGRYYLDGIRGGGQWALMLDVQQAEKKSKEEDEKRDLKKKEEAVAKIKEKEKVC